MKCRAYGAPAIPRHNALQLLVRRLAQRREGTLQSGLSIAKLRHKGSAVAIVNSGAPG
jgi:hypothetical protein